MTSRVLAAGALAALASIGTAAPGPDSSRSGDGVEIRRGTRVEFAATETASRLLSTKDVFADAMSSFDRSARLKTSRDVTEDEFLAYAARQVREWTAAEKGRLASMLESFAGRTARFDLAMPPEIVLVKTTGLEEGNAAYCRGATVVLPEAILAKSDVELAPIVFHELFHVYSTHNRTKRTALYRIIGFTPCPEIALPRELSSRKITNPDAPRIDSVIRIAVNGRTVPATPVLYANTERYDATKGADFFESLVFRLMLLDDRDGRFVPASLPDAERFVEPRSVPGYLDQVGRNTEYIIHPEEILADNFVILITGKTPVATPRVIEELSALLARPGASPPPPATRAPAS